MITRTCSNCGGRLVYNIEKKGLHCEQCGSTFDVKEFEYNFQKADDEVESMDVNVYTCNSCGAQIKVSNTEASTFCVYCGNPTLVFNRISTEEKPKVIIPFRITKEKAESLIKEEIKKGFMLPKEVKNLKVENLRGIYIPYYVISVEYDASSVVLCEDNSLKKDADAYYFNKKFSYYASLPWVTIDASRRLSNKHTEKLEPFNYQEAKKFDEDYLLGFYSDIADEDINLACQRAKTRASLAVDDELIKTQYNAKKIIKRREDTEVYSKPKKALFPAWFMTYRIGDKPYTVLVNGQTGKVVGNFPWRKNMFAALTGVLALAFTSIFSLAAYFWFEYIKFNSTNQAIPITLIFWLLVGLGLLGYGVFSMLRATKKNAMSSDDDLAGYVSDRSEGQ